MKLAWTAVCLIVLAAAVPRMVAQDPATAPKDEPPTSEGVAPEAAAPSPDAEIEAIRAAGDSFLKAFNAHDAKAVAACWTADGDYIDEEGQRYRGRAALQQEYANFFAAAPQVQMALSVESIRLINADTAVEDGTATLSPMPAGPPGLSRYTAVHVKQGGKWLMASVRDSRVAVASQYDHLADLEWLVGDWTTEQGGQELDVSVTWMANKNFLKREFTHRDGDRVVASSLEIIGYDPLEGRVASWTFASDGGYAIGAWSPHETGWYVETSGVTPDGTQTSSVDELARLDDNTVSWRSVNRRKGDVDLPDLAEVILKRKTGK